VGWAERANPFGGRKTVKEYRITLRTTLNEVEQQMIAGPGGQQGFGEKTTAVQITEMAGAGPSPKEALEKAMDNGMAAYLEGLSEASDKLDLLAPASKGEKEGH
jgi:hypothetical protein